MAEVGVTAKGSYIKDIKPNSCPPITGLESPGFYTVLRKKWNHCESPYDYVNRLVSEHWAKGQQTRVLTSRVRGAR